MAGLADVVKNRGAAYLAGIVDQQVAKAEQSLRNTSGDCDVLNLGERNVPSGSSNQTGVDLDFRVSQRITHHVSLQVIKRWNQQ